MTYDAFIDPLAKAALGDAGPAWFEDEAGILADRADLAGGQPPGVARDDLAGAVGALGDRVKVETVGIEPTSAIA